MTARLTVGLHGGPTGLVHAVGRTAPQRIGWAGLSTEMIHRHRKTEGNKKGS